MVFNTLYYTGHLFIAVPNMQKDAGQLERIYGSWDHLKGKRTSSLLWLDSKQLNLGAGIKMKIHTESC